ncbi:MAG TPA: YCF48-related protein [Ignavibacteriaceae bacterium]
MRIKNLLCLLLVLSVQNFAQSFWQKIESPTSKKLNAVVFIDSLRGWAAGDSGLIIHTSDGGDSWSTQYSNDSLAIVNINIINERIGYASATSGLYEPYGSYLLRTTNGGVNWTAEYMRIGEFFVNSITFLDSLEGFAVGYPGFFLRTSDGGSSWRQVQLDSSIFAGYSPYTVKFLNRNYGFACGGARDVTGVIWRTSDSGFSWDTVVDTSSAPPEPLFAINIFDSLNVLVMGGDPEFGASAMKSTDGGKFWDYTTLGILYFPVEVGFRTHTEGWAPMGPKLEFLYTDDSGESWSEIPTPDSTYVTNISFPDSIHGFAVGVNGTMIRYHYQKPNSVKSFPDNHASFSLAQNYPNPFNPSTRINYRISRDGLVRLVVYDILGREVTTLVNEYRQAGEYTAEFNVSSSENILPSGIYFYRLQSSEHSMVKKMILLR